MDFEIRGMKRNEQDYMFFQSEEVINQCGGIGYLRGDFDRSGNGFYTTWFDYNEGKKTEAFKSEFDEVINAMRFDEKYRGILSNRSSMKNYCNANPDSKMDKEYSITGYGFRCDTEKYAYLIRCNPIRGDYNFYIYAYDRVHLDRVINNRSKVRDTNNLKPVKSQDLER